MGQRATGTGTAIFENVAVAPEETLQLSHRPKPEASPRCICRAPSSSCTSPHSRPASCTRCGWMRWHTSTSGLAASRGPRARLLPTIRCCNARSARSPVPHAAEATVLAAADAVAIAYRADVDGTDLDLDLAHRGVTAGGVGQGRRRCARAEGGVTGVRRRRRVRGFLPGAPLDRHLANIRKRSHRTTPPPTRRRRIGAYHVRGRAASRQRILRPDGPAGMS